MTRAGDVDSSSLATGDHVNKNTHGFIELGFRQPALWDAGDDALLCDIEHVKNRLYDVGHHEFFDGIGSRGFYCGHFFDGTVDVDLRVNDDDKRVLAHVPSRLFDENADDTWVFDWFGWFLVDSGS